MEKLFSDQFDEYDSIFDQVCKEFKVKVMPTWHHRWFYRYLQISPSYYYVWGMDEMKRRGLRRPKNFKDCLPNYRAVSRTLAMFGDVWSFDFSRWWFFIGQYQFIANTSFKSQSLSLIPMGYSPAENFMEKQHKNIQGFIDVVLNTPSYPDALILGIPLNKSKEDLLDEIGEILDRNTCYPQPKTSVGNAFINKTKLKEKTLKDCYRVLEIRTRYPDLSLIDLAKRAKTLSTSLAGLNSDSTGQVAQSVRSGISRQLNSGLNIAENAAMGLFPHTGSNFGIQSLFFKNSDLYQPFYKSLTEYTKDRTQLLKDLRKDIPQLIDAANRRSHDIQRLY